MLFLNFQYRYIPSRLFRDYYKMCLQLELLSIYRQTGLR
jgi:hypothetical protein